MLQAPLKEIEIISKPTLPVYSYGLKSFSGKTILTIVDRYDEANPSLSLTNGIEADLVWKKLLPTRHG